MCCVVGQFLLNRFRKLCPKWRWHYSAALGTSPIQLWRNQVLKPSMSMFSGFLALSPTLRKPYCWLWFCRSTSGSVRNPEAILEHVHFGVFKSRTSNIFKRRAPTTPWLPFYEFLEVWNIGSISIKNMGGHLIIISWMSAKRICFLFPD